MTTLEKFHALEAPRRGGILYAVLRRNAGWALQFYDGPEREDDSVPADWRSFLHVEAYHDTFEAAVNAEYERRVAAAAEGKAQP